MNENRLRSALEIATAILLGLVSVATAAGAYQASLWSQQSNEYAAIAETAARRQPQHVHRLRPRGLRRR